MANQSAPLNQVFQALADPTRRAVIERLGSGSAAVSELAAPFDMALPSFLQHLRVLEASGLVRSAKAGRVRTYELSTRPLEAVGTWLEAQRSHWERRLDGFDAYVLSLKSKTPPKPRTNRSKKEKP
ncbi:MAG: metalloregulator ArsR/SmtB family transcription factor [Polyangiales bacterium]|nr:helix-turn-helix transcriptional regulator [Myxococcales bacterium]